MTVVADAPDGFVTVVVLIMSPSGRYSVSTLMMEPEEVFVSCSKTVSPAWRVSAAGSVVSAASAGAAKPAREIFDAAVRAGGANAAETLHVGDHPLHDVQGARDAGLRAVWVNRRQESWPDTYAAPDAEVRHVGEVCALVGVRRP